MYRQADEIVRRMLYPPTNAVGGDTGRRSPELPQDKHSSSHRQRQNVAGGIRAGSGGGGGGGIRAGSGGGGGGDKYRTRIQRFDARMPPMYPSLEVKDPQMADNLGRVIPERPPIAELPAGGASRAACAPTSSPYVTPTHVVLIGVQSPSCHANTFHFTLCHQPHIATILHHTNLTLPRGCVLPCSFLGQCQRAVAFFTNMFGRCMFCS
jgi:hypothetical protein